MNIYVNNFNISILDNTNCELFSNKGKLIKTIFSDVGLLKWNPTVILADPFLFVHNDELFLFYERQEKWHGKGKLCMIKTRDLQTWSEEKTVLQEPFHLSFPFVFEESGHFYMIPETGDDHSVRLYENNDGTLESWTLKTKLLNNDCDWRDSSVVKYKEYYFLFTSKMENEKLVQCLFFSKNIEGPYVEHSKSPIYVGNDYGRNSGSVFIHNNSLYRPTQNCTDSYGSNVSIFKIDKLSEVEYSESLFANNIFEEKGLYINGGHQFNIVDFMGRIIVSTDFRTKNYNVIELIRRIIKHI